VLQKYARAWHTHTFSKILHVYGAICSALETIVMQIRSRAKLWKYEGPASWYFITLPTKTSDEIQKSQVHKSSWGIVRVQATIGTSTWKTSLFRDTKRNAYLLPIKKDIRTRENLSDGKTVSFVLTL
jgi:hypothetical protein